MIVNTTQLFRPCFYMLLSMIGYIFIQATALKPLYIELLLTLFFILGMVFEARVSKYPFFVLLPTVFSVYSLINNMISGILYYVLNYKYQAFFIIDDEYILRGTWYTLVCVQVLWIAFYLIPDHKIRLSGIVSSKHVSKSFILGLVLISFLGFFIAVNFRMYGYVADISNNAFESYAKFATRLGLLSIILFTMYYYDVKKLRVYLYILVGINCLFGLAFGSKSTTAMPILLMIITIYFTQHRVFKKQLVVFALAIMFAYSIIEPFRVYYDGVLSRNYAVTNVASLTDLFINSYQFSQKSKVNNNYGMAFLDRMSYTIPLAKTIEYADKTHYFQDGEWYDLAMSPLYGIIPRFIWSSKPLANFGSWASVNIFGFSELTHTGITPQGYAYLVYRLGGILIFFVLYGLIQKVMFNLLYLNKGWLAFYIFYYFDLGYPSVVPWHYVAGTIQSLIFISPLIWAFKYFSEKTKIAYETRHDKGRNINENKPLFDE